MSYRHSLSVLSLLLAMGLAAPAFAETHAEPAKPETKTKPPEHKHARTAEPKIVTTAFGVWALRCRAMGEKTEKDKDKDGSKPARACEISETLEAPDHSGPIAKLSIGRPGGKGDLTAIVILPNNVSFPSSVHIRSDDKDIWGVRLDWIRCIPGGCFAQASLSPATIQHWHDLDAKGAIVFTDATGDDVSLPMSFQGFGAAIDALNKTQ